MASMSSMIASVTRVTHLYRKVPALEDVSLDIPFGCMVGLLGPDGVGKSTLLGLIAGARKIQIGTIRVLGGDMSNVRHRNAACPHIAYMPQGLGKSLYAELSVFENLDFFGRLFGQSTGERRARIDVLLKATGLAPFPDRPAGKLSGGMKQKLGLCCALIHDPDFLILDEPTTGVDPLSRRQFWDLIDNIRAEHADMSVLVSTAYMDEAERFDSLIAMDAGKILATGSPEELRNRTGSESLEEAFVALLPKVKRGNQKKLTIPPRIEAADEPAIVAKDLTRRFGAFTAVNNVSFSIKRGEIFGFLGSNGCGKTTTMKMLTGLLPTSSGEAQLFGKPVDASNLDTRKRVGYMSQAFSLYGELTVRQNLALHARLFHLSPALSAPKIDELTHRFRLTQHLEVLAAELPLGVRQRLSLAVALIHQPEMLILDEPTSGVDPVARDEFWQLLVDISRNQNVTIFISTHFMNEAMRCDRISLMHAGTVLACDTPMALQTARGAASLEEAFIGYIEEAVGQTTGKTAEDLASQAMTQSASKKNSGTVRHEPSLLTLSRLFAYCYRETLEVLRDPIRIAFAFIGSAALMLIFGFGITTDVENLRYAALDLDQTPESRRYLQQFSSSPRYFSEQAALYSQAEMIARLKANDISFAIEIPPHFGRDFKRGGIPEVSAWIDGAMPFRGETIQGYIQGVHLLYLKNLIHHESGVAVAVLPVDIETRYRYNPSFESIYAMVPAVQAILLILLPAILMAVSVVREKELGTITNFYVTPSTRFEFLLGKQLPYVAIGILNYALLVAMAIVVFQVPLKGSGLTLTLGALLYVMATTGIGLLVSSFTSTQVAAVFATTILVMMPTMQFSGMFQPVSTLDGGAKFIGTFWPATYYMLVSLGAFTKALEFRDLWLNLLALAAFAPVFTILSALVLKKQDS